MERRDGHSKLRVNELVHADVAWVLQYLMNKSYPGRPHQIVSAGSVAIDVISVGGKSETLRMESREQDLGIMANADYGGLIS